MIGRDIAFVVLCVCASAPVAAQDVASVSPATAMAAPPQAAPIISPDYAIGPQDSLNVDVFGVPELSRSVQVDDAGFVALPLIGRVRASGLTANQLSQSVAEEYNKKYLKDPVVTVTVKDAASQKVTVDGSVIAPGVYQITPTTTLTQAVALAKGPDQVADVHHVSIVRNGAGGRTITSFDLDDIHDGKVVDPPIRANDEVVVDVSGTRKFVRDFSGAFSLLYLFH